LRSAPRRRGHEILKVDCIEAVRRLIIYNHSTEGGQQQHKFDTQVPGLERSKAAEGRPLHSIDLNKSKPEEQQPAHTQTTLSHKG
jgi:hypothetical protein